MATDPMKGITVSSSTAGSLGSLSAFGKTPIVVPAPLTPAPKKPAFKKAPPEHPIFALVGRVASGFAHLEHVLDVIIWDLAGVDASRAACITAQLNGPRPRYQAIISLLKQLKAQQYDDLAKEVEKLMHKTFDHAEQRNRIVHDPWYVTDEVVPAQFRSMPHKDQRFGFFKVDETDLETLIQTADELANSAGDVRKRICAALGRK